MAGLSLLPTNSASAFSKFSVVLMVNHACNLRCSYCYTGRKINRPMPLEVGEQAIQCGIHSTADGGSMDLGFFGGEPLLEAERILYWIQFAHHLVERKDIRLSCDVTTNGTVDSEAAWAILLHPNIRVFVSCDGDEATHDKHRPLVHGAGTSRIVMRTIRRLAETGKDFGVVTVVRPDTLASLRSNIAFLHESGVSNINLSLDLWTQWSGADVELLKHSLAECADYWKRALPHLSINWFDEKLGSLSGLVECETTARCGFGFGEVAVAPSGNLYPCERLIGEDRADNPMRLPERLVDLRDFLGFANPAARNHDACSSCTLNSVCSTSCRCSNYVRTGDTTKPDGLLCLLDKICAREVTRVFRPERLPQAQRNPAEVVASTASAPVDRTLVTNP